LFHADCHDWHGYVGLVSGACLRISAIRSTCVDKDGDKIAGLRRGEIPIFEPGLDALVASNVKAGRLISPPISQPRSPRPMRCSSRRDPLARGDGHADLTYVHTAAREIAKALAGFTVVVTKSTVPVGTGDEVERLILETVEATTTSAIGWFPESAVRLRRPCRPARSIW